MWSCPHCRLPLNPDGEKSLACDSGHRFDQAREGYVNLLPANRKRSKEPGDSKDMIAARGRIHDGAHFRPLAEKLAKLALIHHGPAPTLLDLGCGEGYYSQVLLEKLPEATLYGIDISKAAIRRAAKSCRQGDFAVASAFDIPLADHSLDLVCSVFAPADTGQLQRVLQPGGAYLKVIPGPEHLQELRALLYDEAKPHSDDLNLPSGFEIQEEQTLAYPVTLDSETLLDLVAMTPYAHRGKREQKSDLGKLAPLELTMAFKLALMRRSLGT